MLEKNTEENKIILESESQISGKKEVFDPINIIDDEVFKRNFVPLLLTTGDVEKAKQSLEKNDDIDLFFHFLIDSQNYDKLLSFIEERIEELDSDLVQSILSLTLIESEKLEIKNRVLNLIDNIPEEKISNFSKLIYSIFSQKTQSIKKDDSLLFQAYLFIEALKDEQKGDFSDSFRKILNLLTENGFPVFLYNILKIFLIKHDSIDSSLVKKFVESVESSTLNLSYSSLKFLEFYFYYRNGSIDDMKESLRLLAENSESFQILQIIAPFLYKYEEWRLLEKYYKIAAKKSEGNDKIHYLEMQADIYEYRLKMPDFAASIHMTILNSEDKVSHSGLSRVVTYLEGNEKFRELSDLYISLSVKEKDPLLIAYFLGRAGSIFTEFLEDDDSAILYLRKSIELKPDVENIRILSGIFAKREDWKNYINMLELELDNAKTVNERIKILEKISEIYFFKTRDLASAEKVFNQIIDMDRTHLDSIKKLGKLYYMQKRWAELVKINKMEAVIIDDENDTVNLLFKSAQILYLKLNNYSEAEKIFLELLGLRNDHIPSIISLEKIYNLTNDREGLINLYLDLTAAPLLTKETKIYYLTRLAIMLRDEKRDDESLKISDTILYLEPENRFAKENIRMLSNDDDLLLSFNLENYGQDEWKFIHAVTQKEREDFSKETINTLTPDFWKEIYSYYRSVNIDSDYSLLGSEEKKIVQILKGDYSIDDFINSDPEPHLLMLIGRKYFELGYFEGIYKILHHYLDLKPNEKKELWAIFFKGTDKNIIRENLERLFISQPDNPHSKIIYSLLEKVYLEDRDVKMLVFLKNIFSRKIENHDEKLKFLDNSIEELSKKNYDRKELHELYKSRYEFSNKDEKDDYLPKYREYLMAINMSDTLIRIYQKRWDEDKNMEDGYYLINLYLEDSKYALAEKVIKDIAKDQGLDDDLIDRYILVLEKMSKKDMIIKILTKRVQLENGAKYYLKLFKMLIDSDRSDEAADIFPKIKFSSFGEKYKLCLSLSSLLIKDGQVKKAHELAKSLEPVVLEETILKIDLLISLDIGIEESDLKEISQFSFIKGVLEKYRNKSIINPILKYFCEKGEKEAISFFVLKIIDDNDSINAGWLVNMVEDGTVEYKILLSYVYRGAGNSVEEKRTLISIVSSFPKKEYLIHPLSRLKDIYNVGRNKRASFFIYNLLSLFDSGKYPGTESEWEHLQIMQEKVIFSFLNFTEAETELLKFLSLITKARRPMDRSPVISLNPTKHRSLFLMLEKLSIILGDVAQESFFNPVMEDVVSITPLNIPVLTFGRISEKVLEKRVAFDIAEHVFLIKAGVSSGYSARAVDKSINELIEIFKLEGKGRVNYIRMLKDSYQDDVLKKLNEFEENQIDITLITGLKKKLFRASIMYAFSLVPDIKILLQKTGEKVEDIYREGTVANEVYNFAFKKFLH